MLLFLIIIMIELVETNEYACSHQQKKGRFCEAGGVQKTQEHFCIQNHMLLSQATYVGETGRKLDIRIKEIHSHISMKNKTGRFKSKLSKHRQRLETFD
jgi:hypothetical protein